MEAVKYQVGGCCPQAFLSCTAYGSRGTSGGEGGVSRSDAWEEIESNNEELARRGVGEEREEKVSASRK